MPRHAGKLKSAYGLCELTSEHNEQHGDVPATTSEPRRLYDVGGYVAAVFVTARCWIMLRPDQTFEVGEEGEDVWLTVREYRQYLRTRPESYFHAVMVLMERYAGWALFVFSFFMVVLLDGVVIAPLIGRERTLGLDFVAAVVTAGIAFLAITGVRGILISQIEERAFPPEKQMALYDDRDVERAYQRYPGRGYSRFARALCVPSPFEVIPVALVAVPAYLA